jgi:hypothetical protein
VRKSIRERLADAKRGRTKIDEMSLDQLFVHILAGDQPAEKRRANPTQLRFRADPAKYKFYMGPKGCSKTSTIVGTGLERSLWYPGSIGSIARNDYNDLLSSTGKRLLEMIGRLPEGMLLDRNMSQPAKIWLQPIPILSPEGDIIDDTPSQINFVGMNALGPGGSFETHWMALDEVDEMEEANVRMTSGWIRTPERESWGITDTYLVMGAFNPTDTFHWLYTACTGKDHEERFVEEPWVKLFIPEPDENQRNLPSDYYALQAKTMTEDQAVRYIKGQWGAVFKGMPVIPEFKYQIQGIDWHGRRNLIKRYDRFSMLYRGLDFGYRHPYCCWSQYDHLGRLLTMKEYMGTDMEIEPFIEACIAKEKQWFPDHKGGYQNYGDPAARQKKDTGSTLAVLGSRGWPLLYKITTIEEGLQAIRINLPKTVDGEPLLQVDSEGCPILCAALRGGYHRDDTGQKPVKDGFYDHPVDGYRYKIVGLFGVVSKKAMTAGMPRTLEYDRSKDTYPRR